MKLTAGDALLDYSHLLIPISCGSLEAGKLLQGDSVGIENRVLYRTEPMNSQMSLRLATAGYRYWLDVLQLLISLASYGVIGDAIERGQLLVRAPVM